MEKHIHKAAIIQTEDKKKLQGGCRCSSKEICLRDRALNTLLDRMR